MTCAGCTAPHVDGCGVAEERERLRAEVERLREALTKALPLVRAQVYRITEERCPTYDGTGECICGWQAEMLVLQDEITALVAGQADKRAQP